MIFDRDLSKHLPNRKVGPVPGEFSRRQLDGGENPPGFEREDRDLPPADRCQARCVLGEHQPRRFASKGDRCGVPDGPASVEISPVESMLPFPSAALDLSPGGPTPARRELKRLSPIPTLRAEPEEGARRATDEEIRLEARSPPRRTANREPLTPRRSLDTADVRKIGRFCGENPVRIAREAGDQEGRHGPQCGGSCTVSPPEVNPTDGGRCVACR